LQLLQEKELEAQHRRKVDQIGHVALSVQLANVNAIIDIALIDDAIEKIGPIDFLQPLDSFHRVLTAEEYIELRLPLQPLVEAIDNTIDLVAEHVPTLFEESEVVSRDIEAIKQRLRR
jgi:hypothetical protein